MQIQYIHEFLDLAATGNYMEAADNLYISQSSLSKHIMALEKEIGYPLFSRTTRKISLTRLGKAFLPYARRIADADSEFQNVLAMIERDSKSSVRLGVLPAFMSYGVEDLMARFQSQYPHFSISILEGTNEDLYQRILDGTCNIALIRRYDDTPSSEYGFIPFLQDRLSLVAVSGSFLYDRPDSRIDLEELKNIKLLTSTSELQMNKVRQVTGQYGINLNIVSRLSRTPSILELLKRGIGDAALLCKLVSMRYVEDQNLKILDIEPPITSTVYWVYLKDRPLSAPVKKFIDIIQAYIKETDFTIQSI